MHGCAKVQNGGQRCGLGRGMGWGGGHEGARERVVIGVKALGVGQRVDYYGEGT